MKKISIYVWQDVPNWGDQLGYDLLSSFLGDRGSKVDKVADADIVGIGSTLAHIPVNWSGIVAGPGLLKQTSWNLPMANILGIRGKLTARGNFFYKFSAQRANVFIGDPGLITPQVLDLSWHQKFKERADIGILPHWSDTALKWDSRLYGPWKTRFINPFRSPRDVISDIITCDKLVTSSLHGTVIADAYGIPRRIVPSWTMLNSPYEGGMFKFQDYMSALDMEYQPEVLEKADQVTVEKVQADILRVYKSIGTYFNDINSNSNSNPSS